MTREEAIAELKRDIELENDFTEDYINAVKMAIEALEQESVLDNIRADIEQAAFKDVSGSKYIFVNRINQIIDKYKEGGAE